MDRRIKLLPRLAACFEDRSDPEHIEHQVGELVSQRVYALALGYEDLNDHDELRQDPLLALLVGKSTLQRLEGTTDGVDRYKKICCDSAAIKRLLAYALLVALRRLGLEGTRWARAQTETIRRGLLKTGAQVRVSVRRGQLSLASGYPYQEAFAAMYRALRPPGCATV